MCKFIVEDFLTPKVNLREITHSLGGYFNSRAKKISDLSAYYSLFQEKFSPPSSMKFLVTVRNE